jgi:radical SAM superfamily enzyme YgiQ (UPF0313 family)
MNKLFVMFHKDSPKLFDINNRFRLFQNGFSHTWNNCKKQGDMIWLKHGENPPVDKSRLFVSAWYKPDALEAERWARENPQLDVVVGGPLLTHYEITIGKDLKNFRQISRSDVEQGLDIDTSEWGLDILPGYENVGYSFGIVKGIGCYWGKCYYCKYHHKPVYREFETIPIIEYPGHKYIWLHTFSISPSMIKSIYSKLPNRPDVSYMTYMRADESILKALQYAFDRTKIPTENLMFDLGIEVPSNRMLSWMKKGTTVEAYLKLIEFLGKCGCRLHFNLMTDWPQLTEEDVKEVGSFLTKLGYIEGHQTITANLYPLQVVYDRPFMKEFKGNLLKEDNPFWNIDIFHPILTDRQKAINDSIRKMYSEFPFLHFEDFTGRPLF